MSKKVTIDGKVVKLYSDDGRTWVSRKRDLRKYRRKLADMVAATKTAFAVKELAW